MVTQDPMIDAQTLVTEDITHGLREAFEPVGDIVFADEFGTLANDDYTAVVWSVHAHHIGTFAGVDATGNEVEITGVTIVRHGVTRDDVAVFRFIDWMTVLGQLGVTINTRSIPFPVDA
jgi:hypothetical protein